MLSYFLISTLLTPHTLLFYITLLFELHVEQHLAQPWKSPSTREKHQPKFTNTYVQVYMHGSKKNMSDGHHSL